MSFWGDVHRRCIGQSIREEDKHPSYEPFIGHINAVPLTYKGVVENLSKLPNPIPSLAGIIYYIDGGQYVCCDGSKWIVIN
jgi:hypothetical protein